MRDEQWKASTVASLSTPTASLAAMPPLRRRATAPVTFTSLTGLRQAGDISALSRYTPTTGSCIARWTCSEITRGSAGGLTGTPETSVAAPGGLGLYVLYSDSGPCYNGYGSSSLGLIVGASPYGECDIKVWEDSFVGEYCYSGFSIPPIIGNDGTIYVS